MAEQTHPENPTLRSLDPISLILFQSSSNSHQPIPLSLTTDTYYTMERGPRYLEYSELRDLKLKMKTLRHQDREEIGFKQTPLKKQVKFQGNLVCSSKGSSVLAQSVPDFTVALRKENRKPPDLTPPGKNCKKGNGGFIADSRGSKSVNSAGEKRIGNGGGILGRKSYACVEELKGISMAASKAINGERTRRVVKNVWGLG